MCSNTTSPLDNKLSYLATCPRNLSSTSTRRADHHTTSSNYRISTDDKTKPSLTVSPADSAHEKPAYVDVSCALPCPFSSVPGKKQASAELPPRQVIPDPQSSNASHLETSENKPTYTDKEGHGGTSIVQVRTPLPCCVAVCSWRRASDEKEKASSYSNPERGQRQAQPATRRVRMHNGIRAQGRERGHGAGATETETEARHGRRRYPVK